VNYVDRPAFAEGQLLAAVDLELTVDYARDALEAHDATAHVAGVIDGMALALQPNVPPAAGNAAFVAPGFAVDGSGRQLRIVTPMPIVTDPLAGHPSNPYPAYVWYSELPMTPVTAVDPCGTVVNRVRENVNAGVFASAADALAAQPAAVCLGMLQWNAATTAFDANPNASNGRQRGGVRAGVIVAPEHVVAVTAEDPGPTTFTVEGTLAAAPSADGTAPGITIAGGALALESTDGTKSVTLQYEVANTTGNALVVDLGSDDAGSQLVVENKSRTPLLTIGGDGSLTGQDAHFVNVSASASVVVGSAGDTLTLAGVSPDNRLGVAASARLPLAFGTGATDNASFISGANPVATVDPNAITHLKNNVAIGTIDPTNNVSGIAALTDALAVCAIQREISLKPGNVEFLRLALGGVLLNMQAGGCDVTPETVTAADGSHLVRIGKLAVQFGTASVTVRPISDTPGTITFPRAFAAAPAFFVSAFIGNKFNVAASATSLDAATAGYKIVRFGPTTPADTNAVTWSNTKVTNATVSWFAAGALP
jgi:hypothetical protein